MMLQYLEWKKVRNICWETGWFFSLDQKSGGSGILISMADIWFAVGNRVTEIISVFYKTGSLK